MSDFGNLKKIKTRKVHTCLFCLRKIPVKTEAFNYKGMWEDQWQNNYSCAFCQSNSDISGEASDGISGDEFNDWMYDQPFCTCPDCKNQRVEVDWAWSADKTTIYFECTNCEAKWSHFIGFSALEDKI